MAMQEVYSVHDKAVQAYMVPFYCRTKGEALRLFFNAVHDPKSEIGRHIDDYVLYHLGHFDDASGLFHSIEPVRILSAVEVPRNE